MPVHLDSGLLATFAAVANAGSVSGAAVVLGRTQSSISVQVAKLEARAGRTLFVRHPRGVSLTPDGDALLQHARRVLGALVDAETMLETDPLQGRVRIGVPEEYGTAVVPKVLRRFAETHPGVEVTVNCAATPTLEQALEMGELDLAVLVIDTGRKVGDLLAYDPTVWVASRHHTAHEIDPLPLAMFAPDCWWRDWALRALDARGRAYRIAYTSRSVAGIQAAVTSGLAVGVLASSTVPTGACVLRGVDGYDALPGSAVVLRRARDRATGAVDAMAAAIRAALQQPRA